MKVKQLSIFMENRAGRMAEIARQLGEARINIRALSLADTSDFGILRLIVNDVDKAMKILKDSGHTVSLTEVVAVDAIGRPLFQSQVVVTGGSTGAVRVWRGAQVTEMACGASCAPSIRSAPGAATPAAAPVP